MSFLLLFEKWKKTLLPGFLLYSTTLHRQYSSTTTQEKDIVTFESSKIIQKKSLSCAFFEL